MAAVPIAGLDPWAIDLWLYEHGYTRSPDQG